MADQRDLAPSIHSSAQYGDARFDLDEAYAEWARAHERWETLWVEQQDAEAAQAAASDKANALYSTYEEQRAAALVAAVQGVLAKQGAMA